MCEYCEVPLSYGYNKPLLYDDLYPSGFFWIDIHEGRLRLVRRENPYDDETKINFCPMCGRRILSEKD